MTILWVLLALFLVFLNAFFVAAEFGMVKLRHTRVSAIKNEYGVRGRILAEVHGRLDAYLSACQLGITLASLGLGWVGKPAFAHLFESVFYWAGPFSPEVITATALTCSFVLISILHIVVGELMPKSLAIRRSEQVSIWTALPLYGFYWLMYPAIWLMNSCSNALLKLIGLGDAHGKEHFYSTEELKLILSSSYSHGELAQYEQKILEHTLDLGDLIVTDIMRPPEEIVMLNTTQTMAEALAEVLKHQYSRYPVYNAKKDQIMGIVHIKDIFSSYYPKPKIEKLENLMRPIIKVSRRLPALELLRKFRTGMPHFALVYNYRGGNLIGFVTLDNLLHLLVGRIQDEFHRTKDDWTQEEDGSFLVPGNASIYTLERALDIDIDDELENIEEEVDTVTGLILAYLAAMPHKGQQIKFKQFSMVIEKMKGPRIIQVRIYRKKS
ncbi:MAG TPA: hemolysin family protein [Gammaproteobacteria bacterium]|jgi:CBS domain containing-hemolysin-like protein|nr:hemolysin family protein [Gammaproteobacteria bacterium]